MKGKIAALCDAEAAGRGTDGMTNDTYRTAKTSGGFVAGAGVRLGALLTLCRQDDSCVLCQQLKLQKVLINA